MFINTSRGLTRVAPAQIELMRSYAASEWTITREVRVPNALPFFFIALRIVASLAVIAAIVDEYFGGPQDALGPLIVQRAGVLALRRRVGRGARGRGARHRLYLLVTVAERLLLPWHRTLEERNAA